ncbi:putative MarR family transcription regulator [Mesorhizobium sp. J18]|uniref:winged helix DNA-binding protein n=1 Tax=Mesorhizobium sp. J18 TaxID=935263 RepID=UPI00119A3122|nr:winged helix DNA-binding protein [Mesorhizobium sp. J18]TWH01024.1 putative MarR family transcription regulator [Mesorhizobium sp. J18]
MSEGRKFEPVVSAAHLAAGAMPALSEIEYAMTVMHHSFERWMVRCMAAAGIPGLQPTAVHILHAVNHRNREKTLSELCMMFNIEDVHVVSYALKKLAALGLVTTARRGKEKTAKATEKGMEACRRYHEVREALLIESVKRLRLDEAALSEIAATMRIISGQYDQAARSATSL